jgi:hypothetical protein
MGPKGCHETSVRNCHYSLRNNNPEELSFHIILWGSLKSSSGHSHYLYLYLHHKQLCFMLLTAVNTHIMIQPEDEGTVLHEMLALNYISQMVTKQSLPHSQEAKTCPHLGPDDSSPCLNISL